MEIKAGDKVKFLNEQGGGIIIKLIDSRQALVEIEDGFEIPVLLSNLVKTESTGEKSGGFDRKNQQSGKPSFSIPEKPSVVIAAPAAKKSEPLKVNDFPKPLFAFVPLSPKLESETARFELFLLNEGDYYLYYTVALERFGRLQLHEKGELEPEMKVSLGVFAHHDLLKINNLMLDFLVYKQVEYKAQKPLHYEIHLKELNLLRISNFRVNEYFYENAYIVDCSGNTENALYDLKAIIETKQADLPKTEAKAKPQNPDIEEIDLHIEEILENTSGLTPGEILDAQMARFTTSLEGAVKAKTKRIVFIHGVGNGKLKFEVRKTLDNKYPELQYQDASFAEYGFGATMVLTGK